MMKHDDPSWKILGQSVQLPLLGPKKNHCML
jgi:hypothetical protein